MALFPSLFFADEDQERERDEQAPPGLREFQLITAKKTLIKKGTFADTPPSLAREKKTLKWLNINSLAGTVPGPDEGQIVFVCVCVFSDPLSSREEAKIYTHKKKKLNPQEIPDNLGTELLMCLL